MTDFGVWNYYEPDYKLTAVKLKTGKAHSWLSAMQAVGIQAMLDLAGPKSGYKGPGGVFDPVAYGEKLNEWAQFDFSPYLDTVLGVLLPDKPSADSWQLGGIPYNDLEVARTLAADLGLGTAVRDVRPEFIQLMVNLPDRAAITWGGRAESFYLNGFSDWLILVNDLNTVAIGSINVDEGGWDGSSEVPIAPADLLDKGQQLQTTTEGLILYKAKTKEHDYLNDPEYTAVIAQLAGV